ncbi:MAG: type II toxin-antitoxin system VapC family toxin [Verrucomicrobiota bacterium]|nr:type II toxin-antitoxin system VapC family toxin [Verrucomicrobiota bacterium]
MELKFCFDAIFLIDLQKERGSGPAHAFLESHREAQLFWSAITVGEFAEGFGSLDDPILAHYLRLVTVLEINRETALIYSRITRALRRAGKLIGSNHLWIASHAVQYELTLVTADSGRFGRVPRLSFVDY